MRHDLGRPRALQDLRGAGRLDVPARVHGHGGDAAALDAIGDRLDETTLVLVVEQRAEILLELLPCRAGGLLAGAAGLGAGGEFHPVGGEPVVHQVGAHPLRISEAAEYAQ